MNDTQTAEQLLSKAEHMVIAVTLEDNTPWAVPVAIKERNGLQVFEWDSNPAAVHSQAILANPKIALTIFSAEEDLGFYAKATAEQITETPNDYGQLRYRATVTESWLNESHVKREISLT
jgi:hypothetical protein